MDSTRSRQMIHEKLRSGCLPRELDQTSFTIASPPISTKCAGCDETFSPFHTSAIARTGSDQKYWFHQTCEKIWQEERYRVTPSI